MAGISCSVPVKHINDITECPICNEFFTDPRVLPCVHSFCFDCIAKWAEDQAKGGKLACPLCRKEVRIPGSVTSVADLPKNYFVQKVVNTRKLSNARSGNETDTVLCDMCYDDGELEDAKKLAVAYCVECNQNVCKQCCQYHRRMKISSKHRLVELQDNHSPCTDELAFELPEDKCDKHPDNTLMTYCFDCKLPTCIKCQAEDHKSHTFSDVKQLADEMRDQIKADIANMATKIDECHQILSSLNYVTSLHFSRKIDETAKLVTETAEKMKQSIVSYKLHLLDKLESVRIQHGKKVETVRQEMEAAMLMLEVCKHYSEQLENKGTAADIVTSAKRLHDQAKYLVQHKVCRGLSSGCLLDVKFASAFSTDQLHGLFGMLCVEDPPAGNPGNDTDTNLSVELLGVIPSQTVQVVTGVTSLGDDVFVVCQDAPNIDVYEARTLAMKRTLPIGRGWKANESSLAACNRNHCIYLSSRRPSIMFKFRIDQFVNSRTRSWSTARAPSGLSVNQDANVLVTCCAARMIQEFTTDGKLLRHIVLQSDVTMPMQAVQLSGDEFGVTHVGSLNRFCIIGSDGCVVRSYGGPAGSADGQLQLPHGTALNGCGDAVFVADKENHRVLLLDTATLTAVQLGIEISGKAGGSLLLPFCVHYDQSHGRLYIGEHGAKCRVVVVAV